MYNTYLYVICITHNEKLLKLKKKKSEMPAINKMGTIILCYSVLRGF